MLAWRRRYLDNGGKTSGFLEQNVQRFVDSSCPALRRSISIPDSQALPTQIGFDCSDLDHDLRFAGDGSFINDADESAYDPSRSSPKILEVRASVSAVYPPLAAALHSLLPAASPPPLPSPLPRSQPHAPCRIVPIPFMWQAKYKAYDAALRQLCQGIGSFSICSEVLVWMAEQLYGEGGLLQYYNQLLTKLSKTLATHAKRREGSSGAPKSARSEASKKRAQVAA